MKPTRRSAGDPSRLTASLRAAHRCVSVGIHPVFLPHAPCHPGASPTSALTRVPPPAVNRVAARRSSLRFGRNTRGPVLPVGAPPSRALSAGPPPGGLAPPGELGLPGLGAHVGSTTGCSPLRFAPFCVAFRSKYTRASSPGGGSSLTRLVSRAPHRARRSPGFHHRLLTASLRAAHRCVSVEIHPVFLPHAPCQPGASPASALTWVPPPAVHHCASLRSALRFGRNTPGIPPSRALSAGPPPGSALTRVPPQAASGRSEASDTVASVAMA